MYDTYKISFFLQEEIDVQKDDQVTKTKFEALFYFIYIYAHIYIF